MKTTTPKPNWTVRKNVTLPEDLHAEVKRLARRDRLHVYEVIAEGLRLYEAIVKPAQQDGAQ